MLSWPAPTYGTSQAMNAVPSSAISVRSAACRARTSAGTVTTIATTTSNVASAPCCVIVRHVDELGCSSWWYRATNWSSGLCVRTPYSSRSLMKYAFHFPTLSCAYASTSPKPAMTAAAPASMTVRRWRLRVTIALASSAGAAAKASGYASPATTPATHVRTMVVVRVANDVRVASQMHNNTAKVTNEI